VQDNYDEAKRLKVNMEQIKYMAMMHANSNLHNLPMPM